MVRCRANLASFARCFTDLFGVGESAYVRYVLQGTGAAEQPACVRALCCFASVLASFPVLRAPLQSGNLIIDKTSHGFFGYETREVTRACLLGSTASHRSRMPVHSVGRLCVCGAQVLRQTVTAGKRSSDGEYYSSYASSFTTSAPGCVFPSPQP